MTGVWPGWRGFLRGTWTIARTGGGVRAVVADLVAGFRWWLRPPAPARWPGDADPPVRYMYVHGPVRLRVDPFLGAKPEHMFSVRADGPLCVCGDYECPKVGHAGGDRP